VFLISAEEAIAGDLDRRDDRSSRNTTATRPARSAHALARLGAPETPAKRSNAPRAFSGLANRDNTVLANLLWPQLFKR
jgi:hypothetical protein